MATYKVDGAKFDNLEDLKESLWRLYKDNMSREEFEKYIDENVEISEQ